MPLIDESLQCRYICPLLRDIITENKEKVKARKAAIYDLGRILANSKLQPFEVCDMVTRWYNTYVNKIVD